MQNVGFDIFLQLCDKSSRDIIFLWSLYEIIHICTAVVDESEEDHRSKFPI